MGESAAGNPACAGSAKLGKLPRGKGTLLKILHKRILLAKGGPGCRKENIFI